MHIVNDNQIYILNQQPQKVEDIIDKLLPIVPRSISWIYWTGEERKLYFSQDIPNGGKPMGLYYEVGLANDKLEARPEPFLWELKWPTPLSKDTKEGTECFIEPAGEHFFFISWLGDGRFLVQKKDNPDGFMPISYGWECPV
jgi:hypothetical protein